MDPTKQRDSRLPEMVSARLEARLGRVKELKLLFAALSAGTSVVPMGDNGRVARQLSDYAQSLRSAN